VTAVTTTIARRGTSAAAGTGRHVAAVTLLLLVAALALCACSGARGGAPSPIEYGQRDCDFCRMTISDPRYAAELVTNTGKVHPFDSIECLAGYYAQLADPASVRALWVSDYAHPGRFLRADSARFVRVAGPGSPMGRGLRAYAASADANVAGNVPRGESGGSEPMAWPQVLALVSREGVAPTAAEARTGSGERGAIGVAR